MELITVRRAVVMTFFQMEQTNPLRKSLGRLLVPRLVERYGFRKYPQTLDDFMSGELAFGLGVWNDIAVEELRILRNGLLVVTGESTDTATALADDALRLWPEVGLTFSPEFVKLRTYGSALVVRSDVDLANLNLAVSALVRETFSNLYSLPGEAGVFGVSFFTHNETSEAQVRIERLADMPLSEKQYWCHAPLTTTAHLQFLERFEQILSANAASAL